MRSAYATVAAAALLALCLRLLFLRLGPYPDEGGLLVVAQQWHAHGPYLYGDLFVDRPPLLLLFFRLCGGLGGLVTVRLLALGLVAVAIGSGAWAASVVSGRRGAVVAAVVLSSLLADPVLGTREVNAETVALPFTVTAVACVVEAMRRTAARPWLLATGGALSVCALLVKQNLADALVFGVVLVVASGLGARSRRRAAVDLGLFVLGAAIPLTATLIWAAVATPGLRELGYTLYGFRLAGTQALLVGRTSSQAARLHELLRASLVSGLVPLLAVSVWLLRRQPVRDPVRPALLAMLAVGLVGVAGGGYYWTHYLITLVPVTGLLAALAVRSAPRSTLLHLAVGVTVVSTLLGTVAAVRHRTPTEATWVGGTAAWVRSAREPGDSLVVLYGEAGLYQSTDVRPAYPYLWTLPMRVLDPRLARLRDLLTGHRAPTFVVVHTPLDAWGIDPHAAVQHAIHRHYRRVTVVCGSPVYLRRGVERHVPAAPTGCA